MEVRHDRIVHSFHVGTERDAVLVVIVTGCMRPVVRTPRIVVTLLKQQHKQNFCERPFYFTAHLEK